MATWILRLVSPKFLVVFVAGLAAVGGEADLLMGEEPGGEWRTGESFEQQLDLAVGELNWSRTPLRSALSALSEAHRVGIFLDRRIDPGQEITFQTSQASLLEALESLAAELGLSVALIDSVVYIAPDNHAARIQTVALQRAQQARRWPAAVARSLRQTKPLRWPHLAEPQSLLQTLESELGRPLQQRKSRVPHDLWTAGALPELALADRLSILLAGFGLTFDLAEDEDQESLRIVPIPAEADLQVVYPVRGAYQAKIEAIQKRYPDLDLNKDGKQLAVRGDYDQQMWIQRLLRKRPRSTAVASTVAPSETPAEKRYDLRVEGPFENVMKGLADQAGFTLTIDPRITTARNQPVKLQARRATLPDIFRAIAEKQGLRCTVEGNNVTVRPPAADEP